MAKHNLCAVAGCANEGRPQICFYDGRYHHHGRIHYDCGHPPYPKGFFREKEWYYVCDEHYQVLKKDREEWERKHS